MKNTFKYLVLLAAFSFGTCRKAAEDFLTIDATPLRFSEAGGVKVIPCSTNAAIEAVSSKPEWCVAAVKDRTAIEIHVKKNTTISKEERSAVVTISAGGAEKVQIEVRQASTEPVFKLLSDPEQQFGCVADQHWLTVQTNVEFTAVSSEPSWCTFALREGQNNNLGIAVTANCENDKERTAKVTVSAPGFEAVDIIVSQETSNENGGGYIFFHMTAGNYGDMFYAVSRDGINWQKLNQGYIINKDYRGHPDLCLGADERYYTICIRGMYHTATTVELWATSDFITWKVEKILPKSAFDTGSDGYNSQINGDLGAPKMFYDFDSEQYIITWHASETGLTGDAMWTSMRTFYILTSDFVSFTKPQRLFNYTDASFKNMATIDVIIRKENKNGKYYAIIKDERIGQKRTRIAKSDYLTGPYGTPGGTITPEGTEAPTVVRNPNDNGWYLFVESYGAETGYQSRYSASSLDGPWTLTTFTVNDWNKGASRMRHGSVARVGENIYQALLKAYP